MSVMEMTRACQTYSDPEIEAFIFSDYTCSIFDEKTSMAGSGFSTYSPFGDIGKKAVFLGDLFPGFCDPWKSPKGDV